MAFAAAGLFALGSMGAGLQAQGQIAETKLTASDGQGGDLFGYAVAVRGQLAVVGANKDNDLGADSGAAYVYRLTGTGWSQVQKLTPSDGAANDQFGSAVAISPDGSTLVVGAEGDADAGTFTGSAYVFELQADGQFAQAAKLVASDRQAGAHFGISAAADGNTVLIGAWGSNSAGAAYVFDRSASGWGQTAILVPSDAAATDFFGATVALEGTTAVACSPGDDDNGSNSGSGYVFSRSAGVWTQTAKLLASDGAASDFLGRVCSLSGTTIVIGARDDDDLGWSSGSAYVYEMQNGSWAQAAKLLASDGRAGDVFGQSVGVSGDRIVVGAKWRDDAGTNSGAAYLFERSNGVWGQVQRLNAADAGLGDDFGHSACIDGRTILVGAVRKGVDIGAAYLYVIPSPVDAGLSTVTADDAMISAFGGQTRIVVTPRKADGSGAGAGLSVELSTTVGNLAGAVSDNGDGTYSQVLEGAGAAGDAVVSATADGVAITATATVTMAPVDLDQSTVVVNPDQINAGESATVTVTPKTGSGVNSGSGLTVTIQTTLGTLSGQVNDNGDGTYSQQLTTTTSTEGTAEITATACGLPLTDTATLAVMPQTLGKVVGIDGNGQPRVYKTIGHAVRRATKDGLVKILVAPGSYNEVVRVRRISNLTIQAIPTLGLTTVRGFRVMRSHDITIQGFHIDPRSGDGVVIRWSSGITLLNNVVEGGDSRSR